MYVYRAKGIYDAELHMNTCSTDYLAWTALDPTRFEQKLFHELTHIDANTLDSDDNGEVMNAGWIERIITNGINTNQWIKNLVKKAKAKCGDD